MPTRRLLLVVLFFLTAVSIALLSLYLYKTRYFEQADKKRSSQSNALFDRSGRDLYSYTKTWKGEPVAQTADISSFKEIKAEGPRVYAYTPNGNKLLLSISGKISAINAQDESFTLTNNGKSETIPVSEIDQIIFIEDPSQPNLRRIEFGDSSIKLNYNATYNPKRYDSMSSTFIITVR